MTERERQQRAAVVSEALTWIGTPWVHAARVKRGGVDCGQFLADVFERAGVVSYVPTPAYPQDWALRRSEELFRAIVEQYAVRKPDDALPEPGDIALFRYGRCLSHAGIVTAWPMIVHAHLLVGSVVVDSVDTVLDLKRRYAGVWSPWASMK